MTYGMREIPAHKKCIHKGQREHTAQETRKRGAERIETKLLLWLVKETNLSAERRLDTCKKGKISIRNLGLN